MTEIDIHFQLDPYGKPLKKASPDSNGRTLVKSARSERTIYRLS